MKTAIRIGAMAAVVLTAAIATACGGGGSGAGTLPENPPAGGVVGLYVEAPSGSMDGEAVAGVTIGVFTEPFNPGLLQYAPPEPIATATTAGDGMFRFSGLEPGRYFVVPTDARVVVTGRWVTVGPDRGATVRLAGCTDCPPLA